MYRIVKVSNGLALFVDVPLDDLGINETFGFASIDLMSSGINGGCDVTGNEGTTETSSESACTTSSLVLDALTESDADEFSVSATIHLLLPLPSCLPSFAPPFERRSA